MPHKDHHSDSYLAVDLVRDEAHRLSGPQTKLALVYATYWNACPACPHPGRAWLGEARICEILKWDRRRLYRVRGQIVALGLLRADDHRRGSSDTLLVGFPALDWHVMVRLESAGQHDAAIAYVSCAPATTVTAAAAAAAAAPHAPRRPQPCAPATPIMRSQGRTNVDDGSRERVVPKGPARAPEGDQGMVDDHADGAFVVTPTDNQDDSGLGWWIDSLRQPAAPDVDARNKAHDANRKVVAP
jgi:hypothetical protein